MLDTPSTKAISQKNIGPSISHNNFDTSSKKECKKDGSKKPSHDEGDDDIASHQKYMFLVHSHLGQEYG